MLQYSIKILYLPQDKFMHIFGGLWEYLPPTILQKAFFDRAVSYLQELVGSKSVLSKAYLALVVVAGLDKATISMHCYLVASRAVAMPRLR